MIPTINTRTKNWIGQHILQLNWSFLFKGLDITPPNAGNVSIKHVLKEYSRVVTLQTKKIPEFSTRNFTRYVIAGKTSNKCTFINLNSPWTSHMNNELQYKSSNKVQVSYFVELPQSNFPDYTNSLTIPWLWFFSLTLDKFPDISRFQKFQKSCNLDTGHNITVANM